MSNTSRTLFSPQQTNQIVALAWRDPLFKQALLARPAAALAQFLGLRLPGAVELRVVEETAMTLCLVVPAAPTDPAVDPASTVENKVAWRVKHEPVFRQALLADPAATLQAAFGMPFPAGMTVQVLEETPGMQYLVLPLDPACSLVEQELSDLELMVVAGGGRSLRPDFSCQTTKDVTVRSLNPTVTRRKRTC